MSALHGKCHCGETEFEIKLDEKKHVLCHCNACKALSGGAFTLNQVVPKDNVKITKGTLSKYTYHGDSGNPVHCYYCPNCTSHVYHHQTVMGDKLVVRTILLDEGKTFDPLVELYGRDRLKWQQEVAHTFETAPPS